MRALKEWRWIIVLMASTAALMIGASQLPKMSDVPVWAVALLVFGIFWAGYACSYLDQQTGKAIIQIGVRHWKPYIKYIKEKPKANST